MHSPREGGVGQSLADDPQRTGPTFIQGFFSTRGANSSVSEPIACCLRLEVSKILVVSETYGFARSNDQQVRLPQQAIRQFIFHCSEPDERVGEMPIGGSMDAADDCKNCREIR